MAKVSKAMWSGSNGASANFGQIGGMIVKTVNEELQNMALEVQKRAREYVPVDYGYAEKAIKIDYQNQRRQWAVYIDLNEMAKREDGKEYPVSDYIMWLHENQSYKLGPKSLAKEAVLGVEVGPKFLERAFADVVTDKRLSQVQTDLNEVIQSRKADAVSRRIASSTSDLSSEVDKLGG